MQLPCLWPGDFPYDAVLPAGLEWRPVQACGVVRGDVPHPGGPGGRGEHFRAGRTGRCWVGA